MSGLGTIYGVVSTALIEIGNAVYSICKAKKKWDEGVLINSGKKFIQEVINIVLLALSRCGSAIGGMFLGQCVIPIPIVGSVIGLLVGTLVGHIEGRFMSETYSPYLARAVDKLMDKAGEKGLFNATILTKTLKQLQLSC